MAGDEDSANRYLFCGFESCGPEPGVCEQCRQLQPLYFGDRSYWDRREGSYLCGDCLDIRIANDKEIVAYLEAMIEAQRDHESQHMPWML